MSQTEHHFNASPKQAKSSGFPRFGRVQRHAKVAKDNRSGKKEAGKGECPKDVRFIG